VRGRLGLADSGDSALLERKRVWGAETPGCVSTTHYRASTRSSAHGFREQNRIETANALGGTDSTVALTMRDERTEKAQCSCGVRALWVHPKTLVVAITKVPSSEASRACARDARSRGNGGGALVALEVDYMPAELKGKTYYEPSGNGEETNT